MTVQEKYEKIWTLVNDPGATDGEREAARKMLERLEARYGDKIDTGRPEAAEIFAKFSGEVQRQTLLRVAYFLGLDASRMYRKVYPDDRAAYWRKLPEYKISGAQHLVAQFPFLYDVHKRRLKNLMERFAIGYLSNALPPDAALKVDFNIREDADPDEDEAAMSGMLVGARNRAGKALEDGA